MKNKRLRLKIFILLLILIIMYAGCDLNKNENTIKIISIDPVEGLTAEVPQIFKIEVEYTLSTDESGYIWIGFNSDNKSINSGPNIFPTHKSYSIKKGSGKILFEGTGTPVDWSKYNISFSVMATLSAHNNGRFGDLAVDKKEIMK